MSENCSSWCRLCARIPCTGSFLDTSQLATDFTELIQRCFQISHLEPLDNNPAKLCLTCIEFLTKLKAFDETCSRSDKLFIDIVCDDSNRTEEELCSIRASHLGPQNVKVQSLSCTEIEKIQNVTKVESGGSNGINVKNFLIMKRKSNTKKPQLGEGTSEAQRPKNRKLNISHLSGETPHYNNDSRKMVLEDEELPCEFVRVEEDGNDDIIAPMVDNIKMSTITTETEGKFECEVCHKRYTSKKNLNRHKNNHEGNLHKCPICPKEFVRTDYLRSHMRTHIKHF